RCPDVSATYPSRRGLRGRGNPQSPQRLGKRRKKGKPESERHDPTVSNQYIVVRTFLSATVSSRQRPVPRATQDKASSAIETGSPVAARKTKSRLASMEPPPVSTLPLSTMSAASSG